MTCLSSAQSRSLFRIAGTVLACAVLLAVMARRARAQEPPEPFFLQDLAFADGRKAVTVAPAGWASLDHAELVSPDGKRIILQHDAAAGLSACQWARLKAQFVDFPSDKTLDVNTHERRPEWARPRGASDACLAFVVSSRSGAVVMRAVFMAGDTAYSLTTERLAWDKDIDAAGFKRLEYAMNLFSNYFYFESAPGYRDLRAAGQGGKPILPNAADSSAPESGQNTLPTAAGTPHGPGPESADTLAGTPAPENTAPAQATDTQQMPGQTPDATQENPPASATSGTPAATGSVPDPQQAAAGAAPETIESPSKPLPNPADYNTPVAAATYPKDADLERAKRLVRRGRYDEAETIFKGLMSKVPYDSRTGLGDIAAGQGRYQEAIQQFQSAILLNPKAPDAYNGLGKVAFNQGNYRDAGVYFQQALDHDAGNAVALTNLGWVALAGGDAARAQEWYEKALAAGPDDAARTGLYTGLAQVALVRGEPAQALTYAGEILRTDPESAVAHAALAQANLMLNDPELALKAARRAIECDPARHEFYYLAAEAAAAYAKHGEAVAYYQQAIERAPANAPQAPAYFLGLARAQAASGDRAAALATLEKARAAFPDQAAVSAALDALKAESP